MKVSLIRCVSTHTTVHIQRMSIYNSGTFQLSSERNPYNSGKQGRAQSDSTFDFKFANELTQYNKLVTIAHSIHVRWINDGYDRWGGVRYPTGSQKMYLYRKNAW